MRNSVYVYVGQRVRQRRWIMGMTQQQLGNLVGVKFQQIQKYESGVNRISASRIWEMADALDVPISFFFDGLESRTAETAAPNADVLADKEMLKLVRAYSTIPENQRRRLFDFVRALATAH